MKNIPKIIFAVAVLLCIPLIAMQFTDEVKWTAIDFMVMGGLLLMTGLLINFMITSVRNVKRRVLLVLVVLVLFLLTWAELAVGIFGTPFAGS